MKLMAPFFSIRLHTAYNTYAPLVLAFIARMSVNL